MQNIKVVQIIKNILNYVDARLVNHGERVAYMMYSIFSKREGISEEQLRDIVILSVLHDIGAYKTEEINNMVQFETTTAWEHSIYGYLFLKYFSPLDYVAPAIFFHHADAKDIALLPPFLHDVAGCINIADRLDILSLANVKPQERAFWIIRKDERFDQALVEQLINSGIDFPLDENKMRADERFQSLMNSTDFFEEEAFGYIKMMALSLDFRSPQTVTHTVSAYAVAKEMAKLAGCDDEMVKCISSGAVLHDFGKIAIPLSVLEKEGRLTPEEREIIEKHMYYGEEILRGNVDEDIFYIAMRHHEKLDGSGYPHKLVESELNFEERLFAVADIVSALFGVRSYKTAFTTDRVISILCENKEKGLLDGKIVDIACDNAQRLSDIVKRYSENWQGTYDQLMREYKFMLKAAKSDDLASIMNNGEITPVI